jgi:hypothetical protein
VGCDPPPPPAPHSNTFKRVTEAGTVKNCKKPVKEKVVKADEPNVAMQGSSGGVAALVGVMLWVAKEGDEGVLEGVSDPVPVPD